MRQVAGDHAGEGTTVHNLATTLMQIGRWSEAAGRFEQALAIARETDDSVGEAGTLSNLGQPYLQMTRLEEADATLQDALAVMRAIVDLTGVHWKQGVQWISSTATTAKPPQRLR